MFKRHIEAFLLDSARHFPVVLLTGPRQIGKSTLVSSVFADEGFSYVSLDDKLELGAAVNDPRSFLSSHPSPLIIDEAQKAPSLFPEIERLVNESRLQKGNKASNGMYILTGSQKGKLLSESEESLAGRVGIIDMSDLSLNEILGLESAPFRVDYLECSKRAQRFSMGQDRLFECIAKGFYPAIHDDEGMNLPLFYSSYVTTYFEKDLRELIDVRDELKFLGFLKILASNTGQELVYDNYAKQIGVSSNTIKAWVSALVKTGVIYLIEPYHEDSVTKSVVQRKKMYFFDTGLAAYLCGVDGASTLQKSFLKGRFFETFVFNEIRKTYINAGAKPQMYYYRDANQNEIDLVLLHDGELSCVEIKSGQSFNASATKAFHLLASSRYVTGRNAIVCTAEKPSILSDGTVLMPFESI